MMSHILEFLIFGILTFFPMIKIGEFSIPTLLVALPIVLFKKPVIDKSNLKYILIISGLFFPLYLLVLISNDSLTTKDLLFLFYPLLMFATDFILLNVIEEKTAVKFLKIFIIIQLVFCVIQFFNIANTNSLFANVYEYWQEANYQKSGLWELSARTFGTVGSPIYVSIITYIFAKIIQQKTGSNFYIILSLVITLFAGARFPLFAIIGIEIFDKLTTPNIKMSKKIIFTLATLLLLVIAINVIPFIRNFFENYIIGNGDLTKNYSFTHRLDMFGMLIENKGYLLLGGYGIENFSTYVDNEYILRLLQFGVINFVLLLSQYIYLYKKVVRSLVAKKKILIELCIFIAVCMMTANVLTNIFLIQYMIFSLGLLGKRYNVVKGTITQEHLSTDHTSVNRNVRERLLV